MESERGGVLVEVLVSSIMLVITAVGVFSAFDAGTRSTADQRHRVQANGIAEADLARMRTMKISALSNLVQTKVVLMDGTPYTVESEAEFRQDDETVTSSCDDEAKADYIQIRSTVTWPSLGSRDPIVAESLVAPPNGSISTKSGSLVVQIVNAEDVGIEGVVLSGTGTGVFNGITGSNGCAIFGNLTAGQYTLTLSGPVLYDDDGKAPQPQPTSVVAEGTNTLVLQYDQPGDIEASFQTRVGGVLVPSSADAVMIFNSGMDLAKAFGTPGTRQPKVTATPLFPFSSSYAVYAGTCEANDPSLFGESTSAGTIAEALVTAKAVTPVTLTLPALHLTTWSGSGAESPEGPVEGATVKIVDTKCTPEEPLVRTLTTNAAGGLADPGLPFSVYDFCVSDGVTHVEEAGVPVPFEPANFETGTKLDIYLDEPNAQPGACS